MALTRPAIDPVVPAQVIISNACPVCSGDVQMPFPPKGERPTWVCLNCRIWVTQSDQRVGQVPLVIPGNDSGTPQA